MLPIILGTLMGIFTLLVGFFSSISNFQAMIEDDFMDRANTNAVIHSFQVGQLYSRANIINAVNPKQKLEVGYLRSDGDKRYENITYSLELNAAAGKIVSVITTESK